MSQFLTLGRSSVSVARKRSHRMADLPDVDLTPLTTAITKVAEDVVRAIARDMVPSLLTQQVEESLKKMVPSLVEAAVAEEKVLIKETVQEVTRKALPDLLRPMVQQLAEEIVEKLEIGRASCRERV